MRRKEQNFAFKSDTYGEKGEEESVYLGMSVHELLVVNLEAFDLHVFKYSLWPEIIVYAMKGFRMHLMKVQVWHKLWSSVTSGFKIRLHNHTLLAYFPYCEKNRLMRLSCCLYISVPVILIFE